MKRLLRTLSALLLLALYAPGVRAQDTMALLDSLQKATFGFFWYEANPANGLIKDRNTGDSPCSIASLGFGLTSICIAIDHGWVTREAGRERVLTTLRTLYWSPQGTAVDGMTGYKGFFYHFLDMNTAARAWSSELSSIDTALLLAGVVDTKQYFTVAADTQEVAIRELADSIYYRVDWEFMRNLGPALRMGWKPGTGFSGFGNWIGYNEAMIMYILALGSPTYPNPSTVWTTWTNGYSWQTQFGYTYVNFPPLFGHQYSHCWIDFRNIQDAYMRNKGITYFENSRRATLAQRAYCAANPLHRVGYSDTLWGITACDGPTGYAARGAPPAQNDDGTIAPTAFLGSLPFAPDAVLPTFESVDRNLGQYLWVPYGYRDAFNLTAGWWDTDVIGIDEGPIVLMIENYRTESVWNRFMQNADVLTGLTRAGFTGATSAAEPAAGPGPGLALDVGPNPFENTTQVRYRLAAEGPVRLALYDARGREVERIVDGLRSAGPHLESLDGRGLASGVYSLRLDANGTVAWKKCVRVH